jgi:3-oxoadipate enol-lactonase
MPVAKLNDTDLYYEVVGAGPVVAFVHGGYGGAASSVMPRDDSWVDALKGAYTVVTYDRRSAGRSAYPDSAHTLDLFAADLRALLTHLDVSNAIIIGSSAGGPVALTYVLAHPESVTALILPNTSARLWRHEGRVDVVERIRRRLGFLADHSPEETFDMIQKEQEGAGQLVLSAAGRGPRPPDLIQMMDERDKQIQELTDALGRADQITYTIGELRNQGAYIDLDLRPRLGEINMPVLALHGDADTQVPYELGQELAAGIHGAEFVTINGAGHGVMQWPETMPAIRAFCDRVVA